MNKQNIYLLIIFMLMLTTGFIIYFMYLKDPFYAETTVPAQVKSIGPPPAQALAQTISPPPTQAIVLAPITTLASAPTKTPTKIVAPIITASSNTLSLIGNPDTPVSNCILPDDPASYRSIMSRYFGVGFNITYVQLNNKDYYLINHIPITTT